MKGTCLSNSRSLLTYFNFFLVVSITARKKVKYPSLNVFKDTR